MLLVEATTYYHRYHQPPPSGITSSRPTRVPYPTLFYTLPYLLLPYSLALWISNVARYR